MKDYNDIARSVFRRRDVYLQEKKRKREVFMKRSAVALSCCLMMLVGFNIWRTDSLKTIAPSPDKSQFNVTEANTTAPPTTDENGMTGIPVITTAAIATAHSNNGRKSANGTTAEAVPKDTANTVTTTRINNSGTADTPTPTTDSFMAVTVTGRTSATAATSNRTSTVRTVTTASGHNGTTPTAQRTTTSPRITTAPGTTSADRTTTRRTTSRPYTTTAIHTTTRSYTGTGAVYSTTHGDIPVVATTARLTTVRTTTTRLTTTMIYTTMTSPQPVNSDQPFNPAEPIYTTNVLTTAIPTSTTTSTLSGFHYNGNYYKTTGTRIAKDILDGHYIGREYDSDLNRIFYIYAYPNPNIDPDFMCCCYMDGDYAYVGINEIWRPETLGDLLDGINSDYNLIFSAFYDTSAGQVRSISDAHAASELLSEYRSRNLEITGISYNTACEAARQNSSLSPELDLSNKLGYIYVKTPYLSNECSYLQQGYIHITDDGKLEVDLLYLKYTADIGRENADELIKKLKTI